VGSGADFASRMLTLLCDPQIDGSEIAALIAQHPSIYARVLRVANSPYYGQPRSITTIERALILLGRDAVRGIAAATCFDRAMVRSMKARPLDLQAITRHSLATAAAAEELAALVRPTLASEAFIAGLLHNLGIPVQAQLDPCAIDAMIDANRTGTPCEIRVLEATHACVGHEACLATVFEAWQMPESLVAVARHHHAPMDAPEPQRDLTAVVNLGASLGLAIGSSYSLEPAPIAHHVPAVRWLGLSDEQLDIATSQLKARIPELNAALFSL